MIAWKGYTISIIVGALFCGIISDLVSDSRRKKLIHLISGTVLTVTVLGPVSRIEIQEFGFDDFMGGHKKIAQDYVAIGEGVAQMEKERYIKEAFAAYICNKASALGADVTAEIYLDEELRPIRAEIIGHSAPELETELAHMLELNLGITKENQVWIWSQEDKSS